MKPLVMPAKKVLKVDHPETREEYEAMFRLRTDEYRRRKYLTTKTDIDEYDENGKCVYFIAQLDGKIVGTLRVIIDDPLPTERYFDFKEPLQMRSIPRNKRGEISRLIATAGKANHLVLWNLIKAGVEFHQEEDIQGGYASVKLGLNRILTSIGIPIHPIKPFTMTSYNEKRFNGYFRDGTPAIPIYYLRDEVAEAMERISKKHAGVPLSS